MVNKFMDDDIVRWLKEHGITEVECILPDITGAVRGKIIPGDKFISEPRMRLPEVVLLQTVTGEYPYSVLLDQVDSDMELKPDAATLRPVPWAHDPTASLIFDCYSADGLPVETAPRNVLKRVLLLFKEIGLQPVIAPEMEFYLISPNPDPDVPLSPPVGRSGRCEFGRRSYAVDAVHEFDPLFEEIYDYCHEQALVVDTLIHEIGAAQMEINFLHGEALELADQVFLFKRTVREVAFHHKMYATFMAKPMEGEPGSAMHLHLSLTNTEYGYNAFSNSDDSPSELFFYFLGGLQKYLPYAMPFFAPYVNSFRRLTRYTAAPTNVEWGYDNRTVGLRIPRSDAKNRRIENRLAGVDVNPYLVMACSLMCGYLGIREKLQPRTPVSISAYQLPYQFPMTLGESIDHLRRCQPFREILGGRFIDMYIAIKEQELADFFRVISPWERRYLLLHV